MRPYSQHGEEDPYLVDCLVDSVADSLASARALLDCYREDKRRVHACFLTVLHRGRYPRSAHGADVEEGAATRVRDDFRVPAGTGRGGEAAALQGEAAAHVAVVASAGGAGGG